MTQTGKQIMYLIIDNTDQSIHREPNKRSYASTQYKTVGAAKAGITRTVKYYQKAYDQVAECVANGQKEYMANMHNAYRDATEAQFGLTHKQFASSYTIVAVEDYERDLTVAQHGELHRLLHQPVLALRERHLCVRVG